MYTDINENIKVVALFDRGKVIPKKFQWQNRDYQVKEISLAYQQREGSSVNHCFGIETNCGNVFKIVFNNVNMSWILTELWND